MATAVHFSLLLILHTTQTQYIPEARLLFGKDLLKTLKCQLYKVPEQYH